MEGQTTVQDGGGEIPSKIVINGEEFDSKEAQELIGKGRLAREFEQKWNSPIDSLASAYGKSQSELQTYKSQVDQYKNQLAQFEQKKDAGTDTPQDLKQAREAAKKLGIVLDEDINGKFISVEKFDEMLNERLTKREEQQKQVQSILSQASELEKELDGSDGRPKFHKKAVLAYAAQYGIADVRKAYEDMWSDELKGWQDSKVKENKRPAIQTIKSTGGTKEPVRQKITDENLVQALREARGE